MKRTLMVAHAFACCTVLFAQQPTNPPRVVKTEAKEIKPEAGAAPAIAPVHDEMTWEFTGAFDVGPAHPDCAASVGAERDRCTAQHVLKGLQSQGPIKPGSVAMMVDISFTVNEYGEVKDIGIQGIVDQPTMQKAIVALYAMPRFAYATKGGARCAARCVFHIPAEVIIGQGKK